PVPTFTPTPKPTATPVPTFTPTPKPTATPVPTFTPTPKPTATPVPTPTATPGGPVANFKYSLSGYTQIKTLTQGWLPLSGSINAQLQVSTGKFTADLVLNDTKGTLRAIGFLPVTATVGFRTEGPTSGTLIDDQLKTNTLVTVLLKSVKVWGVTIGGGGTCQSAKASTVKLASSDSFDPTGKGGTIIGTYGIGNLTGCGAFTDLISTLTAGTGNTLSAELTPVN
ncbi:MAG: hypothetical protein J7513_10650, partial [Solirubrobacteraceae bacterium]|nr:hypothetical protein [Solirubrobacteraceae bacterium]